MSDLLHGRKLASQIVQEQPVGWYVIHARDREDSLAARASARDAHLARMRELLDSGRLLVAGPLPAIDADDPGPAGYSGSVVIARFDSLVQASEWAQADPYVAAGAWEEVEVLPFRKVLP